MNIVYQFDFSRLYCYYGEDLICYESDFGLHVIKQSSNKDAKLQKVVIGADYHTHSEHIQRLLPHVPIRRLQPLHQVRDNAPRSKLGDDPTEQTERGLTNANFLMSELVH